MGPKSFIFSAGFWWSSHHRNSICFGNDTWPLHHLAVNIYNSVEVIKSNFSTYVSAAPTDHLVKWKNNNHICVILKVDGSCHGSPIRSSLGEF